MGTIYVLGKIIAFLIFLKKDIIEVSILVVSRTMLIYTITE